MQFQFVLLGVAFLAVLAPVGMASASEPAPAASNCCKAAVSKVKCDCRPPAYPAYDLAHENQGVVKAKVKVNEDGSVEQVTLTRSSGSRGLNEAALEFFRRACYRPAQDAEGKPVAGEVEMSYHFSLH